MCMAMGMCMMVVHSPPPPDELLARGERLREAGERLAATSQELAEAKAKLMPVQLQLERASQERDRFEEQCKYLQGVVDERVRVCGCPTHPLGCLPCFVCAWFVVWDVRLWAVEAGAGALPQPPNLHPLLTPPFPPPPPLCHGSSVCQAPGGSA